LRVASWPIPMARIRRRRAYRDFAASANIPEVLALVRCLRRGCGVVQLRGDLVDLLRLRLQLVEGNLDSEVLRQHFEDRLRGLRIHKISGRLAHEADRVHVIQSAEAQEQAARSDDSCPGLAPREHHAVLSISFTSSRPVAAPRTRGFVTMRPMPYPPRVKTRRTPSF